MRLFDTHTHFDIADFDDDRLQLAQQAAAHGIGDLVLVGFLAERFAILQSVAAQLRQWRQQGLDVPRCYLAPGLHPYYIEHHRAQHLVKLADFLQTNKCIAIGEIGLDRFDTRHKNSLVQHLQADYFIAQLELAKQHDLPVMLHIRKAHGETLHLLKQQKFKRGGIAHAFSGGVEEAKAFVRLGFKIGITGQITNPNAKRLRAVVAALSADDLVLETDCPDMTPLCCQHNTEARTRNTPANLVYVLAGLAQQLELDETILAEKIWHNTAQVLDFIV